jgi:hypothetical protein
VAALDFGVLSVAKDLIEARFGTLPSDAETLLVASAAEHCTTGDPVYRPYYVLGVLMGANWQQFKSTTSASGASVEYASPAAAQRALWDIQATLDTTLCEVPTAFTNSRRFEVVM